MKQSEIKAGKIYRVIDNRVRIVIWVGVSEERYRDEVRYESADRNTGGTESLEEFASWAKSEVKGEGVCAK